MPESIRSARRSPSVPPISDPELVLLVSNALRRVGHPSLAKLEVSIRKVVVTLRGQVDNSYLKVLAMKTALTVAGAWWVVNCLEVCVVASR
jgi:hypothetical protein